MKLFGGILIIIGVYLGVSGGPLFFVAVAIGLLLFIQGVENSIIEHTTEYVRRAITENKTYADLIEERFSDDE